MDGDVVGDDRRYVWEPGVEGLVQWRCAMGIRRASEWADPARVELAHISESGVYQPMASAGLSLRPKKVVSERCILPSAWLTASAIFVACALAA